jgi:hypothetical protein
MSLAGEGVVAIWNDIVPEAREQFYEWHNREHMPERVGIPGFRRGRRYIAQGGTPEFFTLYETASPQVLVGADYLARLNHPTEWTRRTVQGFRNVSRSLCRVAFSAGCGQGGCLATLRYAVAAGREDDQRRALVRRILPELADQQGIAGAHLCIADRAASEIETAEKRARGDRTLVPEWVVLVEGGSEAETLAHACAQALGDETLLAAGALPPIERGLYLLQHCRAKTAASAG